jgi:hypothetical protein
MRLIYNSLFVWRETLSFLFFNTNKIIVLTLKKLNCPYHPDFLALVSWAL